MNKHGPKKNRITAISQAKVIHMLMDADGATVPELIHETGLTPYTLRRYLAAMRAEKIVHVCRWERDGAGRPSIRGYKLGRGKDVPQPCKTRAETVRQWRARVAAREMIARMAGQVSA